MQPDNFACARRAKGHILNLVHFIFLPGMTFGVLHALPLPVHSYVLLVHVCQHSNIGSQKPV